MAIAPFDAHEVVLRIRNLLQTRALYLALQHQNRGQGWRRLAESMEIRAGRLLVKHDSLPPMRTMTVRDLRQRWPQAEALLETEGEILITRDAKPVARLVRFVEPRRTRPRFDPRKHAAWQARVGGRRVVRWVDEFLARERNAG